MNTQQTYTVLQPVHLDGLGTVEPGQQIELHPRQAVFLVTGGVIEQASEKATEKAPTKAAKPTKKEAAK